MAVDRIWWMGPCESIWPTAERNFWKRFTVPAKSRMWSMRNLAERSRLSLMEFWMSHRTVRFIRKPWKKSSRSRFSINRPLNRFAPGKWMRVRVQMPRQQNRPDWALMRRTFHLNRGLCELFMEILPRGVRPRWLRSTWKVEMSQFGATYSRSTGEPAGMRKRWSYRSILPTIRVLTAQRLSAGWIKRLKGWMNYAMVIQLSCMVWWNTTGLTTKVCCALTVSQRWKRFHAGILQRRNGSNCICTRTCLRWTGWLRLRNWFRGLMNLDIRRLRLPITA